MKHRFLTLGIASLSAMMSFMTFASEGAPAKAVFDVTHYGAVGNGKTLNTTAIQAAIDQCAAAGGGTLLIPQGAFLSGAIFLKPGVNLHLAKGAVLQGSTNIADYPERETRIEGHFQVWIPALVNAKGADHLRIDGEGTIQGGGKPFWNEFWRRFDADDKTANLDVKRPRNIFIQDSKDVHLSGFSLQQSGFWNLHLFRCRNVVVDGLDIQTPKRAPSTDGIDVDSCQNVTIHGCFISVDDDNVAIKGNKGTSALEDKTVPPDENIHIYDCTFGLGNGAVTLGSEATRVRNVLMENCKLVGKQTNRVLTIKLRPDTEQHYTNITVRNVTVDNPAAHLVSIKSWMQYFDLQGKPAPSQWVTGVTMSGITGNLKNFGQIDGPAKSTVRNITFKDIEVTLKNPVVIAKNVKGLKFENVRINGAVYPGKPGK
jgi:alpha-L-rhamnosidase